jgi:hypothetical protein
MTNDADLPQQPHTVQQPSRSFRLVLLLLGLFPPVAWYFLWKEKRRQQFFPILLYIYGSLILTSSALYTFFLRPQIAAINPSSPPPLLDSYIGSILMSLLMIYAASQIAFGRFIKREFQKYSCLPIRWLLVIAVMFVLDTIFFASLFPAIIGSWILVGLYSLIDSA